VRTHARLFGNTAEGTRNLNEPRTIPKLRTPGVLAADLGEPLHRVLYVLSTRKHIRPAATAGRLRLYDRDAVELLRHEMSKIDARQTKAATDAK